MLPLVCLDYTFIPVVSFSVV